MEKRNCTNEEEVLECITDETPFILDSNLTKLNLIGNWILFLFQSYYFIDNEIGSKGIKFLSECLKYNSTLTKLCLSCN